ncbi:hypothetical protein [Herbiconiux sp. VKM Ac-2851]|uniref:hypothetical protein n=1 Tax=Herbiconiux sp. VKM Ac-2851 TaxID=2739025 RepID=UPI001565354B|nr:hypothetical protein [Herbiconiux sp. VKM Ac-2851]NQX34721.1 hypothetical protein [Herbiconiux sp. VKM Ac-2851]
MISAPAAAAPTPTLNPALQHIAHLNKLNFPTHPSQLGQISEPPKAAANTRPPAMLNRDTDKSRGM